MVVTNKKFWEKLPADLRAVLETALTETTARCGQFVGEEDSAALDAIKQSGKMAIYAPTPTEMKAWRQEFRKVHAEMAVRLGKDLIASIYKETGAAQ